MKRSRKLTVAGILDLIAGGLGFYLGPYYQVSLSISIGNGPGSIEFWNGAYIYLAELVILVVLPIASGVASLRGKTWGLAFAGSLCAIPVLFIGLPASILLWQSKEDWSKEKRRLVLAATIIVGLIVAALMILCTMLASQL